MNAKKAKKIRKLARELAQQTMEADPEVAKSPAQLVQEPGNIVNNISTTRGVYQYLKNPVRFSKRFEKDM